MNPHDNDPRSAAIAMSPGDFAMLGEGAVGYIREIDVATAADLIGEDFSAPLGESLFCLYQADGTPMAISPSRDQAKAEADEHDLLTVSVH